MRRLPIALLGMLAALPAAHAAGVEVTLAAGIRGGEASFPIEASGPLVLCVTTPCLLAEARTAEGDLQPTLIVGVPITDRWMIEGLLTRPDGDLELRSAFPPSSLERETYEMETFQVGLLRHWGEGRLRPFAVAALGATAFESSALAYERPLFPGIIAGPVDEEVLSGSLAGGVKVDLGARFAVRLEARAFWHDLSDRSGGTLQQSGGSLGLTYRF